MPQTNDYTLQWWTNGFPSRSPEGRQLRCMQTGWYAVAMDVEKMTVPHLGLVRNPLPYALAATQDNSPVEALPAAGLELVLTVDGMEYRCVRGGPPKQHSGPRLIEDGRFLARGDVTDLVFENAAGGRLSVDSRFEVVAWPDRLTMLLEARPPEAWRDASMTLSVRPGPQETLSGTVSVPAGGSWDQGTSKTVAVSLQPGGQDMVLAAAEPAVTIEARVLDASEPLHTDYDTALGWHRVLLDGIEALGGPRDAMERVRVTVTNESDHEQPARLLFEKTAFGFRAQGITGLTPMLRDVEGHPLGIPVQISKNWHSQPDRELVYQGAWLHGFTLLRIPPHSRTIFEFTLVYAHWGGVAAASHAQLCLVGWGSNQLWNESAIGSWGESICYEPDQAQAQAAVLDVRPLMVHATGQDKPVQWTWTNNVGGGDFFRYFDPDGERQFPVRMKTAYHRYGPNLTEVTYAGCSQDGHIEHRATVSLHRGDDIVRGVYRLRMDVRQPTPFSRFVVFQAGADSYSYTGERKMAWGNEDGLVREWDTEWGGGAYKTEPFACTGRVPWLSLHEAVSRDDSEAGAWANRGIVIRAWKAKLGGRPAGPWAAEYGVNARGVDTSVFDIVPPLELLYLEPGDYVEATIEHVVMPQFAEDYYGPNANLRAALAAHENSWRLIEREAVGNALDVTVETGVLKRNWPPCIKAADGDRAAFAVTGGLGYVPVTIAGLSGYRNAVLEMRETANPWEVVDQSVHGKDFWQADFDPVTRQWDITYTLPLDSPDDVRQRRDFRFRLELAPG